MIISSKTSVAGEHGVVTIEFTLVATILFFVLFAIIYITRFMYIVNATADATRYGARLAVVCDISAAANIKSKMVTRVPELTIGKIDIAYNPSGCNRSSCESVTVSVSNFSISITPMASTPLGSFNVPSFSTTLIRESMDSSNNSVCS